MSNATKTAKRSDFKKYFQFMWRSLNIQASWNYERQMNMGFLYGIAPTLDELYPNGSDRAGFETRTAADRFKRR